MLRLAQPIFSPMCRNGICDKVSGLGYVMKKNADIHTEVHIQDELSMHGGRK